MTPRPLGDVSVPTDLAEISVLSVLHALSDRTRAGIVQELLDNDKQACGSFHVGVARSTLSHHFKVLREAGLIRQREVGRRRLTTLRPGGDEPPVPRADRDHHDRVRSREVASPKHACRFLGREPVSRPTMANTSTAADRSRRSRAEARIGRGRALRHPRDGAGLGR